MLCNKRQRFKILNLVYLNIIFLHNFTYVCIETVLLLRLPPAFFQTLHWRFFLYFAGSGGTMEKLTI
jgi:hypothetical protein